MTLQLFADQGLLNRPEEFALHVRAAIGNGVTREELEDALIQVGIYCGIPAGVEAFRIASGVLREIDSEKSIHANSIGDQ